MARESRTATPLSDIRSMRALREARREFELREMFARRRLEADIRDTFTLDNLFGMVSPPGSLLSRVLGGVGTGLAAALRSRWRRNPSPSPSPNPSPNPSPSPKNPAGATR